MTRLIAAIVSLAVVEVAAFYAAIGLAYRAGQRRNVSFLGAEASGYFWAFIGATALILLFKMKGMGKILLFYFVSIVGMAALYRSSPKLMLREYAAGFEKAAFSAASPAQWLSVVPLVETWISTHSGNSIDKALPPFARRVYPYDPPYSGVFFDDPPDLRNIGVLIFWRGTPHNIGLKIGPFGPTDGLLYQRTVTNGLSIVIMEGG